VRTDPVKAEERVVSLGKLNPEQQKAVLHEKGPLLVIAGAGSGKTRTLTFRIAHLIGNMGVSPYNVLAVTFTNKAAAEMRERVENLLGRSAEGMWVTTFHSACVRILRMEAHRLGWDRNFLIFDVPDQISVIKECMYELGLSTERFDPRSLQAAISSAKNELVSPARFQLGSSDLWSRTVARVYRAYQEGLRNQNAFDFDDLIMYTVKLFKENPDVLEEYQERFQHILVDEYQDTNHAQYVLVNLLASRYRNLTVVGDEDQSIYGFRGANIRNILDFEEDYPDSCVVKLERNYRSTGNILKAANHMIARNRQRKGKELWTDKDTGAPLFFCREGDEKGEAAFVAREIFRLKEDEGKRFRDVVILYRTHAQSRALEEEFLRRGLPYEIVAGLRFYERKEIKDLLAYLRFICNQDDTLSLRRIINVPRRGIGDTTVRRLEEYAMYNGLTLWEAVKEVDSIEAISGRLTGKVTRFRSMMEELIEGKQAGLDITQLTQNVLDYSGYMQSLREDKTRESEERIENLKEFLTVTRQYGEANDEADLAGFLEHVALMQDVDAFDPHADVVTMMTLHSAKGLEFPVVFMVGMEEGIFPHSRSTENPNQMEEERRLCYVGITRAMELLYLTCTRMRTLYGSTRSSRVSRFVGELPRDLLCEVETTGRRRIQGKAGEDRKKAASGAGSYRPGDKVRHREFGDGLVVAVNGSGDDAVLSVAFDHRGVKKLIAGYAPLQRL